jgi:hypothetical protein
MRVTELSSFDEYWSQPKNFDKRPVRNGSRTMMVGDNIYHREAATNQWCQADSHHSNVDGSPNLHNLRTDTKSDRVLLSRHFFYFGSSAPTVPAHLLDALGYRNGRNYRVFDSVSAGPVIAWLHESFAGSLNLVTADPFDFASSERRYSVSNNKIT